MNFKIENELSKTKKDIIKINDLYLHSKFDPQKEAERLAKENYQPHHLHIVFGIGLGYIVQSLIEIFKFNEPVLVIDPLLDLGHLDFEKNNYGYDRIYRGTLDNEPELSNILSKLGSYNNKVKVIIGQNYNILFPKETSKILQLVKDSQVRELHNVNTINWFAMQWQLNSFLNMKSMVEDLSLEALFKKYDTPVVVASGGPSLTKQLGLLKQYREKVILICAGSTINSLLLSNITPDYVVTIDGGIANYNHFKNLKLNNVDIIYSPTSHYKIRESFNDGGFAFINPGMKALHGYFKEYTNKNFPIIPGGGSVAHYALSIAKRITNGPICLIGQDLAYTNQLTHATGNKGIKGANEVKKTVVQVEGYDGDAVETNDTFKTMIDTFEQLQLSDSHNNGVFNCTEGGAKIKLYDQIPFEHFLKTYCQEDVERLVFESTVENSFSFEDFYKNQFESYNAILQNLDRGIKITEKENGPYFNINTLNQLSKIDKKLNKLYTLHNLDTLLEPIILKNETKYLPKLNESKLEEFNRVKHYTIGLYEDCKKRLVDYINIIEKELGGKND